MASEEDVAELDRKVKQLKLDYERYFLGLRPREPVQPRGEVERLMAQLSAKPIQNTALRFRYASIASRYQAFKRQWNETLRQIETGTYTRHRFKAQIHERGATHTDPTPAAAPGSGDDLYSSYRDARLACGQAVENLSRARLDAIIEGQRKTLEQRFGSDARFRFRVVVEEGRAKLKASRQRD